MYSEEFDEGLKEDVRARDGRICRNCGRTEEENLSLTGKKLSIHHKDEDKSNNSLDNLVSLCSKCHGGIHFNEVRFV